MLLKELKLIDEIKFVHPKDVQDGKVELSENDISCRKEYESQDYGLQKSGHIGHRSVIEHRPVCLHDGSHGIQVEKKTVFVGTETLGITYGGGIHPCHGDDPQDMFQVSEICSNGRCYHGDAKGQKIFYYHDGRQEYKSRRRGPYSRSEDNDDHDYKAQEHIDKTGCYIGYGDYLPGEIDLLDKVLLGDDGYRSAGDGGGKEHPGYQCYEKKEIEFLDIISKDDGKDHIVDEKLQQGIDKCPQET
jgi:hypothetical protein